MKVWLEEFSKVFTREAVFDETHNRKSTNVWKSIVGIVSSQLYSHSRCQPTPTGLYTRYEFVADSHIFKPGLNKSRKFGKTLMSFFFQRMRPDCRIERCYSTEALKKIDCFKIVGFWGHCHTLCEAICCFYHYCFCQEARPAQTEEYIQRGTRKREIEVNSASVYQGERLLLSNGGNVIGGNSRKLMCQ